MSAIAQVELDERVILGEAAVRAAKLLGLTNAELGEIIGRHRTNISKGLDPSSKEGELAMMFIRCYRNLFGLMGGNEEQMKHWMYTENLGVGGVPVEEMKSVPGISRVLEYLDAIRGKI